MKYRVYFHGVEEFQSIRLRTNDVCNGVGPKALEVEFLIGSLGPDVPAGEIYLVPYPVSS